MSAEFLVSGQLPQSVEEVHESWGPDDDVSKDSLVFEDLWSAGFQATHLPSGKSPSSVPQEFLIRQFLDLRFRNIKRNQPPVHRSRHPPMWTGSATRVNPLQ